MSADEPPGIDVPKLQPPISGSEESQTSTPSVAKGVALTGPVNTPVDQRHLGAALRDFADIRSAAVSTIAVAAFEDAVETKADLSHRLQTLETKYSGLLDKYHDQREKGAVLNERLREIGRLRRATQLSLITGSALAGTGLPLIVQNKTALGIGGLLTLAGSVFVAVGLLIFHQPSSDTSARSPKDGE
jgi:hypothetical protein